MKSIITWRAILPFAAMLAGCDPVCENEVLASVASPSGKLKAIVFNRSCGATVGYNTQVSVIESSAALPDAANVLIMKDAIPLKLQWVSENRLSITGARSNGVFKKESSAAGVTIAYD